MAVQQTTTGMNSMQLLSDKSYGGSFSNGVFRPPAVNDIPELSKDNLLNMLNQIPDLKGRQFNIEYATGSAPDGYPIPFNMDSAASAYPEPVIVDKLPQNVLQHVKNSNNTALTAALEASIDREQRYQAARQTETQGATLNMQPAAMMHHTAQSQQPVQQSRPASSNDSGSSTEVSSSGSSSEESDSDDSDSVSSAK